MFNNGNYKLGDFCTFKKGKHYPKTTNPQFWNGSYDWLTIRDIKPHITSSVRKLSQLGVETVKNYQEHSFKKDTFVISCDGTIGEIGWLNKNFYSSTSLINFDTKNKTTNKYLYYFLLKNKEYIKKLGIGSVIKHIYIKQLKKLKLCLPLLEEQQKIIDIIEPLEKNLDFINYLKIKLENFIKYLPRSKNNNFIYLKQVSSVIKNKNKNLNQITAKVLTKRSIFIKFLESKNTYKTNLFFCPKNTLLINSIRTYLEKFAILPNDADVRGTIIQLNIRTNYLSIIHNLLNDEFWKQAIQYSKGTKMPMLSEYDLLNNIKIFLINNQFKNINLISFFTQLNTLEIRVKKLQNKLVNLLIK